VQLYVAANFKADLASSKLCVDLSSLEPSYLSSDDLATRCDDEMTMHRPKATVAVRLKKTELISGSRDVIGLMTNLILQRLFRIGVTSTPIVVVHAPASCGRGLEGDGRSILEVTRRRRRRHANSSEIVLSDFQWNIYTEKCLLTTRLYYTRAFAIVSSPQLSRV